MNNFDYYNPTKIVFGNDTYERLADEIKAHTEGKNVLITYVEEVLRRTAYMKK